jgi:3-dehydroquinate synthetase
MSLKFRVALQKVVDSSYDIEIGEHLFDSLIEDVKQGLVENVSKFAIVTDSKVKPLYGEPLLELLLRNGIQAELNDKNFISFPKLTRTLSHSRRRLHNMVNHRRLYWGIKRRVR